MSGFFFAFSQTSTTIFILIKKCWVLGSFFYSVWHVRPFGEPKTHVILVSKPLRRAKTYMILLVSNKK